MNCTSVDVSIDYTYSENGKHDSTVWEFYLLLEKQSCSYHHFLTVKMIFVRSNFKRFGMFDDIGHQRANHRKTTPHPGSAIVCDSQLELSLQQFQHLHVLFGCQVLDGFYNGFIHGILADS